MFNWRSAKLFSNAAVPFYIPNISALTFQFFYIFPTLVIIWHFDSSHPVDVKLYLRILIFVTLMSNDVKHLFMCLLAIYISCLEKCLFKCFAIVELGYVFLLLSFMSTVCILILIPYQTYMICKYLFPYVGILMYKNSNFHEVQFVHCSEINLL